MDPGWYAKLEGNSQVLDELVENFDAPSLRVTREREPEGYYLGSTEFGALSDSSDVRALATELLQIACGAIEVERGPRPRPQVASLRRVDATGNHNVIVFAGAAWGLMPAEALVKLFPGDKVIAGRVAELVARRSQRHAREWAVAALGDYDIRDVLVILGREDIRWQDLYHVFEIVQEDAGGRMFTDGSATKADVDRFKHTANSRGALGREARHGRERTQPPANPMTLDEARQLVLGIVGKWLQSKVTT